MTESIVYDTGNRRFLTYSRTSMVSVPGVAPSYTTAMIGNTAYTNRVGGYGGMTGTITCQTTIEITNGVVASYRYEGNGCKSK